MKSTPEGVGIAEGVVYVVLHPPCALADLRGSGVRRDQGCILVQVTGQEDLRGLLCGILRADRDGQVADARGGIDNRLPVHEVRLPALNAHTVCRIDEGSVFINSEGTVATEELLVAVGEDEEAAPLNGKVALDPGGLQRALRVNGVDGRHLHAKPHLLGIHAADFLSRPCCTLAVLVDEVLEVYTILLEARGIHVRDVVTNDIHAGLVILKSGNSRIQ